MGALIYIIMKIQDCGTSNDGVAVGRTKKIAGIEILKKKNRISRI